MCLSNGYKADEVVQCVEVFLSKPNNLSSILRTPMVGGEDQVQQVSSDLHTLAKEHTHK